MSREAAAPQVQAPYPDISAGRRPGLWPLLPSGSQQPGYRSQGAQIWLRILPPALGPGQSSPTQHPGPRALCVLLPSTQ